MRGDNHLLALTTKTVTHEDDPTLAEDETRIEPLFAMPIQVCKATAAEADVKFDNAAPSGAPYDIQYVDTATGEVFEYGDRLRGVKVGDEFRAIDSESIAQIDEATKLKTIVIEGKAPLADVRTKYGDRVTGVYYLQSPKEGSPKAYRLVYESLLAEAPTGRPAMALVAKRSARTRQKFIFIYADEQRGCLVLNECVFAAAMRDPDAQVLAPQTAQVDAKQVAMARKVIDAMPDGLPLFQEAADEAVPMKRDLIEAVLDGEAIVAPVKPIAETVEEDSLEAALAASLG